MTQQLREAVAAHPDGIAMMGHPGAAAIMPLAEEAAKAGIKMVYQNVPVPTVVAKFGGGYVGAQQVPQGQALGDEAVRRFGLKKGDMAIVILASNESSATRAKRAQSRRSRTAASRWSASPAMPDMGGRSQPGHSGDHRGLLANPTPSSSSIPAARCSAMRRSI